MTIENTLTDWVTKLLAQKDPALFLVNIEVSPGKGTKKLMVYLDGDQGIPIDVCAEVSRALSHRLDEEDLIDGKYTLEVSSPGLSQPLLLKRQYIKNVGRHIKVLLNNDKTVQGKLLTADQEQITVAEEPAKGTKKKVEAKEITIPFTDIKKTNVVATF